MRMDVERAYYFTWKLEVLVTANKMMNTNVYAGRLPTGWCVTTLIHG